MRLIRRLFCWLGAHRASPGTTPRTAWLWTCESCGQLLVGGRGAR